MQFETLDKSRKFDRDYIYFETEDELYEILKSNVQTISSGSGLSFAPFFLDKTARLISHKKFNKIINFDRKEKLIEVQSGCQLYEIQNFLLDFNYMIKIHPGWPTVTVGGSIANSIHGKNPYLDGTFGDIVHEIKIILPGEKNSTVVSKNKNTEIFYNTIGGYGLTGTIVSAKLKVIKIVSNFFLEKIIKIDNFKDSVISQLNNDKKIASYSWHDTILRNSKFGTGLLFEYYEDPDKNTTNYKKKIKNILDIKNFHQPINFFNSFTYEIINIIYKKFKLLKKIKRIDIYYYLYPMMSFPIPYWFFFNGYKGFIEHQIIIPKEYYESYFFELKNLFYKHRMQAYNSFLKLFNGKRSNLRFDGSGIAFSIEFLNDKKSHDFLKLVDEINCKYGAITALYKDSRISKKTVIRQYGDEFYKFEKFIKRLDPKNFIKSNFKNKFFNYE